MSSIFNLKEKPWTHDVIISLEHICDFFGEFLYKRFTWDHAKIKL